MKRPVQEISFEESVASQEPPDRPLKPACSDPTRTRFPVFHQDKFFFIMEEHGISSGGMNALCFEGELLDPDRFVDAVARMMDRNPKCASRIVRVPSFLGERFYWEPLPDAASRVCRFHEPDPALKDRETLEALIQDLMNVRLNMESAPPLVFHWFPYGDREGLLTFRYNHALCDGLGSLMLTKELLCLYNGIPIDADVPGPYTPRAPMVEGTLFFKLRLLLRGIAFHLRKLFRYRFAVPEKFFDPSNRSQGELETLFLHITAHKLRRWLTTARGMGATLNDLLMAAFAVAIRRWKEEQGLRCGTIRFVVNQSLRQEGQSYPATENRSSSFPVWVGPRDRHEPKAMVHDLHRQVQEALRLRIADATNLLGVVLKLPYSIARRLLAPLMNNPRISDSCIITNVGMFATSEDEGGGWFRLGQGRIVKFYPGGRPTDGIGAICLLISIPEGAVLSFMGMKGLLKRPEMERLTQLVETTLDELASTNAAQDGQPGRGGTL